MAIDWFPLWLSLRVAVISTVLAAVGGVALAYLLANRNFKGKEALDAMDPLCTLRYSATHVDQHHMVYRLNAVDAYAKRLVKQIEVASAIVEGGHNKAYVRVDSIKRTSGEISSKLEVDVEQASGVKRKKVKVLHGDDLEQVTHRDLYADFSVGEISVEPGSAFAQGLAALPTLSATPARASAGDALELVLRGNPGDVGHLFASLAPGAGATIAGLAGDVFLDLGAPIQLGAFVLDDDGEARLTVTVPALGEPTLATFQWAAVAGTVAVSNPAFVGLE